MKEVSIELKDLKKLGISKYTYKDLEPYVDEFISFTEQVSLDFVKFVKEKAPKRYNIFFNQYINMAKFKKEPDDFYYDMNQYQKIRSLYE